MRKQNLLLLGIGAMILLTMTACFSGGSNVKSDLSTAIEQQLNRTGHSFTGEAALQDSSSDVNEQSNVWSNENAWTWNGNYLTDPDTLELQSEWDSNGQSFASSLIYHEGMVYTHFPELLHDDEYLVTDETGEWLPEEHYQDILLHYISSAVSNTSEEAFSQTENDSGTVLTATIGEEDVSVWLEAVVQSIKDMPLIQYDLNEELEEAWIAGNTTEPGEFHLYLQEDGTLERYTLQLPTDTLSVHWEQSYADANEAELAATLNDASLLSWEDVLAQVEEIRERGENDLPTIDFESAIDFKNEYEYAGERQDIQNVVKQNLQAFIDRDKDVFDGTFRRDQFAERQDEFWETDRKYRFIQIEDLSFKNLSRSVSVGVTVEFVDPGDQVVTVSALRYTLNKNDHGEWKIDNIR